ncbi:MAG: DUF2156 domain-containing protein [Tabrizicola sp.]|nr:DUF2156 domain-containing protein [Tabrizicola sp.]
MARDVAVRALRPRVYRQAALTAGLATLFLWLLINRLQEVEPSLVFAAIRQVGPLHWLGAALATWVSFRAIAGYDLALHRHLQTGIAADRAGRAGLAAIAIAQTVGMGVISGGFVRWRIVPELGLWGAMRLSLAVAVSFLLAWAALTSGVLLSLPSGADTTLLPWVLGGGVLLSGAVLALLQQRCPNLITLTRLLALATVDCVAAGLALWLLMPGDISFAGFLPLFLLALGAGLMSGSPAGLGAFEIVLLALAVDMAEADLLAGIVAWRVLYYGLPAVIGAGMALAAGPEKATASTADRAEAAPAIAEAGLARQGEFTRHPAGFLSGRTAHGLVALSAVASLDRFRAAARDEGRWPVLYKLSARDAVAARKAGLTVLPLAFEAWISPAEFRLDLAERAGLRRKLRRAEAAGVRADTGPEPDWAELAAVNAAWVQARGCEHGFSMGRFDPAYLSAQRLVVARAGARMMGFASFHVARLERGPVWTLDLLRPAPDAPEGTAQLLVATAIRAAAEAGVRHLSLAAVPIGARDGEEGIVARLERVFAPGAGRGLAQFKAGFAPRWQRLYIAGPSHIALGLVGAEIWHRVHHPQPLAKLSRTAGHDAEYEFASGRNPWQRGGEKTA